MAFLLTVQGFYRKTTATVHGIFDGKLTPENVEDAVKDLKKEYDLETVTVVYLYDFDK